MELDDESPVTTTITQRYKEYKNSVSKIGLEEAHVREQHWQRLDFAFG